MTPAECGLLCEVIESGQHVRQRGDAVIAKGLQSAGMATMNWIDEGRAIRVIPTELGRRWHVLVKALAREVSRQIQSGEMGAA